MINNLAAATNEIILRTDFQELDLETQTYILGLIEDALREVDSLREKQRELNNEYRK